MRLFGLLMGLGLAVSATALVGTEECVKLRYAEGSVWMMDLPGPCGEPARYLVRHAAPVEGEPKAYEECAVVGYDEKAGTITLACEEAEDVVIKFGRLSEWLALEEECDVRWSPSVETVVTDCCYATVPAHTCGCSACGLGHYCESGTNPDGWGYAICKSASGTIICTGKNGLCVCGNPYKGLPGEAPDDAETCECEGKCSVWCPKGFLPSCFCRFDGQCGCIRFTVPVIDSEGRVVR